MESPAHSKPVKDKTYSGVPLIIIWALMGLGMTDENPHQIHSLTWQIISQSGEIAWEIQGNHALNTWWPTLTPDFCQLAAGLDSWDIAAQDPSTLQKDMTDTATSGGPGVEGCSSPRRRCILAGASFFLCPKDDRSREQAYRCGGYDKTFCAAWGCETTGDAWWNPTSNWDKIKITRGWNRPPKEWWPNNHIGRCEDSGSGWGNFKCENGTCLPLKITFTESGKKAIGWQQGYTWGLQWYRIGRGLTFKIKLKVEISSRPVGPNSVLPDQKAPSLPKGHQQRPTTPPNVSGAHEPTSPTIPGTGDRLLNLIRGAYQALNRSSPDQAKNCWLCLNPSPPYYEGIAFLGNFTNHTSPPSECLGSNHQLTLTQVSGTGTCIGKNTAVCNQTLAIPSGTNSYLVPPNGTYWACNTGLTPCVSTQVLNLTQDYCVLVQLWPRMSYHSDEDVLQYYEGSLGRFRREPVSLTLAMMLGIGGITAGIATGTAALIRTDQYLLLHQAMNEDLQALEKSVRALKESLTSLSEVVLQNRRGLDLLFLKEGGLCAALREECCFYMDQTGMVTETLDKLKERLDKRQREFESQQSWYEGIFNRSPWFTTLISSLMGPIILLMLILTFGPCILNRLVQFVKDRLSVIQALVLTQQYHQLKQYDHEDLESNS